MSSSPGFPTCQAVILPGDRQCLCMHQLSIGSAAVTVPFTIVAGAEAPRSKGVSPFGGSLDQLIRGCGGVPEGGARQPLPGMEENHRRSGAMCEYSYMFGDAQHGNHGRKIGAG
jgi:hypothetical protein